MAAKVGADVVVGFSIGASVALEMVASGAFTGSTVLLGVSLSTADEPAFFRAIVRLGDVLGGLPASVLARGAATMVKKVPLSAERVAELRGDFLKNDSRVQRRILREYLQWLKRDDDPAGRLCQAGVPTWVVHAEKGDGGLTDGERRTLQNCGHVQLVTIPGSVFFLPVEVPERIADIISQAVAVAR